uniref:Low-density lipoprotein receptor-related protein 6-like n=1 Tax=Phallusia mammillata TaxID=59560 RepID=A0A6F9DK41_9ASCI|nr:low-density lipoprotein receptor-related protein 6-like [Phallusia mammillata]
MTHKNLLIAILIVQILEALQTNASNFSTTTPDPCSKQPCNQTCLPGRETSYKCGCRQGYRLLDDETSCVVDIQDENFMLVLNTASHKILQVPLNESQHFTVLSLGDDVIPTSLAYDHVDKYLFYWDAVTKSVWRSRLNGTEKTVFLAYVHALYMAIDDISRNLYIVDGLRETILVASLQIGNITKTLPVNDVYDKMSLHVDTGLGKIFWCESGSVKREGIIESANFDGSKRKIHVHDQFQPIDISVDSQQEILYWIDKLNDSIGWFDLKSGDKGRLPGPIKDARLGGIAIHNSTLYVTTIRSSTDLINNVSVVFTVRVDGLRQNGLASYSRLLEIPFDGNNLVYLYPKHRATAKTACGKNKGGCNQICLPGSNGMEHKCVCGDNYKLVVANNTCIQDIDNVPSFGLTCSNAMRIHYVNQCKGTALFNFTEPTATDVDGPVQVTSLCKKHPPFNLLPGIHLFSYKAVGLSGKTSFCHIEVAVRGPSCQDVNYDRRFGATPGGNFSFSLLTTRCPLNTSGKYTFFRSRYGISVRTLLVECHPATAPSGKPYKDPQNTGNSASMSGGFVILIIVLLILVLGSAAFILHRYRRGNSRLQYYLWRKDYDVIHLTTDSEETHHYA